MPVHEFASLTWEEVAVHGRGAVAILPVGALEAHGPHLPLATDVIIAEAMARSAAARLDGRGLTVLLLPAVCYTPAPFAAAFPGTVSLDPATLTASVRETGESLARHGVQALAIANAHLDPAHLGGLHAAASALTASGTIRVGFPDLTQRPWGGRLTDEFKSGACHAGQFETSIVLAARPELVRSDRMQALRPNPRSLSQAIRDGIDSFEAAGGPLAYFGNPAAASAREGETSIDTLGGILEEATLAVLDGEERT